MRNTLLNRRCELEESDLNIPTEENGEDFYSDQSDESRSSLDSYFKTISRSPLLSEEERIIAKRIKEDEKECKD